MIHLAIYNGIIKNKRGSKMIFRKEKAEKKAEIQEVVVISLFVVSFIVYLIFNL